jgi:hypothetical protein
MPHDVLGVLQHARAILATNYCKWTNDDGHGNHCASGAIRVASSHVFYCLDILAITNDSAIRLHPELKGAGSRRLNLVNGELLDIGLTDWFDDCPTVYVNNQLGQQAILEVFDDAIANLEVARLCAQVESQHPGLDVEKEAEGETVRSH